MKKVTREDVRRGAKLFGISSRDFERYLREAKLDAKERADKLKAEKRN